MNKTLMLLMMEHEKAVVPLKDIHEQYFGIDTLAKANQRARAHELPVPVFRMGSNKSDWLIRLEDLAFHMDKIANEQKENWQKMQSA